MTKTLFLILITQLISVTQALALIKEVEPHGRCEKYQKDIEVLNRKDYYFSYSVQENSNTNVTNFEGEVASCVFDKRLMGSIDFVTKINKGMDFIEVNQKLEEMKEKFSRFFPDASKQTCVLYFQGHYLSNYSDPSGETYDLSYSAEVSCYSYDDINFIESFDIQTVLKIVAGWSDFSVEMTGAPSPVISGTTIHN